MVSLSLIMIISGKFCPSGVISFIFDIKGKTLPNEGEITIWSFRFDLVILDTKIILEDSENSLELTLALGDSISTKITFDGQNVKEKAIDETIGSYK